MQNDDFKFIALAEAKGLLGDERKTDAEFAKSLIEEGPRFAAMAGELAMLLKFGEA